MKTLFSFLTIVVFTISWIGYSKAELYLTTFNDNNIQFQYLGDYFTIYWDEGPGGSSSVDLSNDNFGIYFHIFRIPKLNTTYEKFREKILKDYSENVRLSLTLSGVLETRQTIPYKDKILEVISLTGSDILEHRIIFYFTKINNGKGVAGLYCDFPLYPSKINDLAEYNLEKVLETLQFK